MALAALLVVVKLQVAQSADGAKESAASRLRHVDFVGTGLLGSAVVVITLLLDQGGKNFAWRSWWAVMMGGGGAVLLVAFVLVEAYLAREPIFNLRILRRPNVPTSYLIISLQIMAQVGMMFSVPLYFQVTQRSSAAMAGIHVVPAVVGNTLGGLLAGVFIRRTGHYKILLVLAGLIASITYSLQYLRWNGQTGLWGSLYILPGGMGTGIASASAFVAMTTLLQPEEVAMATSGFMLLLSFAMTAGVTTENSVLSFFFQQKLRQNLNGPGSENVRVSDDVH